MQAGMQAACVHDGSSCKRLYNLLCPDVLSNVAILTQAWQVVQQLKTAAKPGLGSVHLQIKQTEQYISNTFGLTLHDIWLCKADRLMYWHNWIAGSYRARL